MKAKTEKRVRLTVRWTDGAWIVSVDGQPADSRRTKLLAVRYGRLRGRRELEGGRLAQLVIYNKNGRIAYENTYGKDPRRSPG